MSIYSEKAVSNINHAEEVRLKGYLSALYSLVAIVWALLDISAAIREGHKQS